MAERDIVLHKVDITNNRFGKLKVLEMKYGVLCGSRKRTKCLCVCDCGNEYLVDAEKLKSGRTISCGCDSKQRVIEKNRKDLTGKRFGRLVVMEMLWEYKPTKVRCVCDCGNIITVINTGLTTGKTSSCGCLQKERASNHNTKNWSGYISKYGIELIKQSHKNKNNQWIWECRCGLCDEIFFALPAKIASGHITSCGCRTRSSKEQFIKSIFDKYNIDYIEQYRFSDCKNKYTLPFDFAIFKNDKLTHIVEYDGIQHYIPVDLFGGEESLVETKQRDAIKNDFCKANNLNLLRLPYYLTEEEIEEKILNIIYP